MLSGAAAAVAITNDQTLESLLQCVDQLLPLLDQHKPGASHGLMLMLVQSWLK